MILPAQAAEALASSFPAALPQAAKALLRTAYNETYVWFRVCVDGAISFGASAAFDHQICSRQAMAAHFSLNTTPVPSFTASQLALLTTTVATATSHLNIAAFRL